MRSSRYFWQRRLRTSGVFGDESIESQIETKPDIERQIETSPELDGRTSFKVSFSGKDLWMKVRGELELTLDGVTYTVRSDD